MTITGGPASDPSEATASAWPLEVAALPERLAIDLAFSRLSRPLAEGTRFLLISSNPIAIAEALLRVSTPVSILHESGEAATAAIDRSAGFRGPQSSRVATFVTDDDLRSGVVQAHDAALWIAPDRGTWRGRVNAIDNVLEEGSHLAIVGAGPMGRVATRLRPGGFPVLACSENAYRVGTEFGYRTETRMSLYGLRSALYGAMRIAAERFRRLDLADRFEAAYRLALLDARPNRASAIGVWIGQK